MSYLRTLHRFLTIFSLLFLLSAVSLAQEESPVETPGVTIHVVQRGENLYRIAQSYALTIDDIARINGITNTASIQVGQRLLIPLDSPQADPVPIIHVIQPGESLGSIAQLYGVSSESVLSANSIVDANTIFIGQVLQIPTADIALNGESSIENSTESALPETAIAINGVHVVSSGETLFRIATSYGLTVSDLQQANGISDPTVIFAGQELVIPGVQTQVALDLPASISNLQVTPLSLTEGQTGEVRLTTLSPASVSVTFNNQNVPVLTNDDQNFIVFLAIPIWTAGGIYPIQITVTPTSGAMETFSANLQVRAGPYGSQYITLPQDRIELLSTAVEDNELAILRNTASGVTPERYFDGPMSLPAAAAMNSPFGTRRSYNGSAFDRYHSGADFAGAPGSPILAAASGRVVLADTLNIRGISVMIDHGWGIYTHYAHMTERYVQIGDFVTVGQMIGTVGSTGRATGAHLHWELWVNGVQVDPMQWVQQAFP
ncbi:MAG: LysM peptidoglycan-binding domain-containing protein [Aggregatilineales bacterium]